MSATVVASVRDSVAVSVAVSVTVSVAVFTGVMLKAMNLPASPDAYVCHLVHLAVFSSDISTDSATEKPTTL